MHTRTSRAASRTATTSYHRILLSLGLLLATAFALAVPVLAQPAPAETATDTKVAGLQPRLVRPGDMKQGALLLQSVKEGLYVQAPVLATDVEIDITGPIARTKVTQRFENPGDGWIEGVYVFPLPDESAVDTLKMQIGDRFIEGEIKEREEARQIYEKAKAEGKKASLLEQERGNIFTNSVANIGPGETVVVQIEYQETIRQSGGEFSLRFPLVVGPRYMPEPTVHTVSFDETGMWGTLSDPVPDRDRISPPVLHPDAGKINPVLLKVNLQAGFPLGDITSHHHKITIDKDGKQTAEIAIDGSVPADKDFELTWRAAPGNTPAAAMFRQTVNGEDYLLVMVTPPEGDRAPDLRHNNMPREVIFVIDNSGSMSGESIRQAKASLLLALSQLESDDTFNVIRFDDTFELIFPTAVAANQENLKFAAGFVSALEAEGGTEMLPALKAALNDINISDTSRVRQVIFLTDGAIGNEEQLFAEINQRLGRSRLFTVGIGSAPNTFFMTRAAERGRGTFTHIGNESQVQERMNELFTKLENPVLTDLTAAWPDGTVAESWPNPLPDLYAGEPIVVSAKMQDIKGTLKLEGMLAGAPWITKLKLSKAREGDGVAKLWARKKIASIEAMRYGGADWEKADKAIVAVALDHHLVSRVTSLVAVDVTKSRPDGEPLATTDMPLNLPEGWDFEKVFGPDMAPRPTMQPVNMQRDAGAGGNAMMAMLAAAPAPNMPAAGATGAALPQSATEAELKLMVGLALMALALMLLLGWRRRERRLV